MLRSTLPISLSFGTFGGYNGLSDTAVYVGSHVGRREKKGVRPATGSEKGKNGEWQRRGKGPARGRAHCGSSRWVGAAAANPSGALPPFPDPPQNPLPPQLPKPLAWHLLLPSFLCCWFAWERWGGLSSGFASEWKSWLLPWRWLALGETHTNSSGPFAGGSTGPGVGDWEMKEWQYLFREKEIHSQTVGYMCRRWLSLEKRNVGWDQGTPLFHIGSHVTLIISIS